ncbi:MAG: TonB-dependent receptor [Gammaproteobacteria bacterium]
MPISSVRLLRARGAIAILAASAAALPLLAPTTAAAAKDELVTTTARGRTEAVQDVPATIAVITQDDLESFGVQRVDDFVNLVPGVSLVNAAEVGDTQINIRGINGARDAENSIALVIDGILMTNPAAVNREYTNLQQIEVLKGPQGAIYGRNAAAGAFIVTTQMPGEEFGFNVRGAIAEDDSYNLLGNVTGPIGDSLGYNVGFDYRTTDGFYKNRSCTAAPCSDSSNIASTDGVTDTFESWNIDGRLVWDVSDNWTLDGKFRYGEVDASSITFNSVFHLPGAAAFLSAPAFNEDVNDHPFGFNTNVISTNDQESTEFSVRSTTDLGWSDMTIWGLYSNIENNLGADGTSGAFGFFFSDPNCINSTGALQGFPLNPPQALGPDPTQSIYGAYTPTTCDGTQFQVRNQKDYSFEIRLASKGDQRLRWSAGLYFLNIDREVGVNTGVDSGNGIVPQLYVPNGGAPGVNNATEQLIWDQFDTDVYAVFGSIDYDIADELTAGFALRYDNEERDAKSLVPTVAQGATAQYITCGLPTSGAFTDPVNPGLCPDVNPSGTFSPRSAEFDEWQPKATLKWDVFPTLAVFASYGVGFKSGGFNNQGSEATVDKWINSVPGITSGAFTPVGITDDYEKETSGSAELGFKSTIGDALRWEAAVYRVDVDNMQFFEFLVGPFGLLRVVENIDDVKIIGVELSGTWSPTDWLNLFAGGNLIDSEIKSNSVRPDTVGNESPYTPEWTLNAGGSWSYPITAKLNVIGSLDVSGVGKTWFHAVQAQERPTGAAAFNIPGDYTITQRDVYWLTNVRLGVGGENWSAVIFGRNVGDEEWLQEVIPAPEFGGSFTHPGSLSRWGIEATYSF